MIRLINDDNIDAMVLLISEKIIVDCIYADCIYEKNSLWDMRWVRLCYKLLKDNGIFYIQTDHHSVAEYKIYLDSLFGKENFINWLIYKQEWGGSNKRKFPQKHDDILMYSKGKDYKFYPERIQIPKITAGTKLDKKGTGLKIPCSVFDDLGNFSTISKERVKLKSGKNIQWQKPQKLLERILQVCTDEEDLILDPFLGSGSSGIWCKNNKRNFIGIENDYEVFKIAKERIES